MPQHNRRFAAYAFSRLLVQLLASWRGGHFWNPQKIQALMREAVLKTMIFGMAYASFVALSGGLITPVNAETANIHSTYSSNGTWWEVAEGRMYWAGNYWLFSFNDSGEGFSHQVAWNCPASAELADGIFRNRGYCIMTDSDGDQIFSTFGGEGPLGETFTGRQTYNTGTGKYEGITGGHNFFCNGVGANEQGYCRQEAEYTLP